VSSRDFDSGVPDLRNSTLEETKGQERGQGLVAEDRTDGAITHSSLSSRRVPVKTSNYEYNAKQGRHHRHYVAHRPEAVATARH